MAYVFKGTSAALSGTLTAVLTTASAKSDVVQSVFVTNTGSTTAYANVSVRHDGSNDRYVANKAELPVGQTLVLDKVIVLEANDILKGQITEGSADIAVSYLNVDV